MTLYARGSSSEPLLNRRRNYLTEDMKLAGDFAPQLLIGLRPNANSVFVTSAEGPILTLKPAYGGGRLSASYSFLPRGLSGRAGGGRGGAHAQRRAIRHRPLGREGQQRTVVHPENGGRSWPTPGIASAAASRPIWMR